MNVNKRIGRFKQWAGERMGGEEKTTVSDDFKSLEVEMSLRHKGMERLQRAMTLYVKSLSKRNEAEDKEKSLPVGYLGSTMVHHGEDFEDDSQFGQCLISMGRTNERVGRIQETYVTQATQSWLESLDRSLAQMKDYQAARKKLESRRLAYDTALAKMQKAKKEDFRTEEELRTQKAKYEEANEEVYRRMQDIKEAETDSITDLGSFVDAELSYYDKCRSILLQMKEDWPAGPTEADSRESRSRSNTAHAYRDRYDAFEEEPPLPEMRPAIRSTKTTSEVPRKDPVCTEYDHRQPSFGRAGTFAEPMHRTESSPGPPSRLSRVPSENFAVQAQRSQLRSVQRAASGNVAYNDAITHTPFNSSSPERFFDERQRSASPATSYESGPSRSTSFTTLDGAAGNGKKAPPPPPPSRAKKPPPPPPPPMKRSALSTSNVSYA